MTAADAAAEPAVYAVGLPRWSADVVYVANAFSARLETTRLMALFDRETARSSDESSRRRDAATRALSVTAVENDFVERVYEKLAKVYDFTFGPTLHPGRLQAIQRMAIQPGDRSSRSASAPASTRRSIRASARSPASTVGVDAREGARADRRARTSATCACCRWTPPN